MSHPKGWTKDSNQAHRDLCFAIERAEESPDAQVAELIRLAVCGHDLTLEQETRVYTWLADQL